MTNRSKLAALVPSGETVIELGVARGKFALELLTVNPAIHYIGIDKWNDHHDASEMREAQARIDLFKGNSCLIHSTFADALDKFDDESAFMIYVDGYAHTGQDGGQTLMDWWPKVKPGGIFAGHDYCTEYHQTIDAVDQFLQIIQSEGSLAELEVITDSPYDSWMIRKPQNSPAQGPR